MSSTTVWQVKLHARLHDPAEKALVLLRDPEGHENGTSRALHRLLGYDQLPVAEWLDPDNAQVLNAVLFKQGIPTTMYATVKRADWWAAAADRPQWPMKEVTVVTRHDKSRTFAVAEWARVNWTKKPVLIHPLTGKTFDLHSLSDTDVGEIKTKSFAHLSRLVVHQGETIDYRKTLAAFWRFGPELRGENQFSDPDASEADEGQLGALWPLLPADTRVPDHSIWDHLDLTSAFAGAFAADQAAGGDGTPALLAVALGPVQGFIAAARKTEDLWAGSHLLSRLAWEAMKVVCAELGPDAIVFPRLRGVPQVDVWLRDELGLGEGLEADWFAGCEWTQKKSAANPLFAAALPNRFVAVVPAQRVQALAEQIRVATHDWLQNMGRQVAKEVLAAAELPDQEDLYLYQQMREQLTGFPEVHWAAVPFSLIRPQRVDRQTDLDLSALQAAMAPFFGTQPEALAGFLATPAWRVLAEHLDWKDGTRFFAPNPGVLYPAVYDLVERVLAAAKTVRPFAGAAQAGYRDTLSGEVEWLTHQREHLSLPPGQRAEQTLWGRISQRPYGKAWVKAGEHLGALSAIKRLWPGLFAAEVARVTGSTEQGAANRWVVSTHTMALAHQLDQWLERGAPMDAQLREALACESRWVALPRRLVQRHHRHPQWDLARRLPAYLESQTQDGDEDSAWQAVQRVQQALRDADGHQPRLEAYYALLLMDGDQMGKILAGDPQTGTAIRYAESFHPKVRQGFAHAAQSQPRLAAYGEQQRALSPGRHFAISAALNDFALSVVPEVVESEYLGKLIYAGGDDVLAMLPVADVLPCANRLRHAYAGEDPQDEDFGWKDVRQGRQRARLVCKNGFAMLRGRLLRMMGGGATLSAGIVIAHHQAPLDAVRRALTAAEQRAKQEGGRNAFSVTLIKRAGGMTHFTARWDDALLLLQQLIAFLREPDVSRRAVYHSLLWLKDLPESIEADMLATLLGYQLQRQCARAATSAHHDVPGLARRLAEASLAQCAQHPTRRPLAWLRNLLIVAEFLARETRESAHSAVASAPKEAGKDMPQSVQPRSEVI